MTFTVFDYIFADPLIHRPSMNPRCSSFAYFRVCLTFLLNALLLLSCFLFVGIAIDRLEAISSPLSRRFDLRAAKIVSGVAILFTAPFVFFMSRRRLEIKADIRPIVAKCHEICREIT